MKAWIGPKRIVFIPMIRPADENRDHSVFLQRVKQRVLFDFGPSGDKSFANYVHTLSRGRAWVDALIPEPIETPAEDLMYDPRTLDQARNYAATRTSGTPGADYFVAMIGQNDRGGAGGSAIAGSWVFRTHVNAIVGEFFMEAVHTITGLMDYYVTTPPHLDRFDPMAASSAHPTAFTKSLLGWLDGGDIVTHGGGSRTYAIRHQAVPTPGARIIGPMAVKVPSAGGAWYIESRRNIDQFEASLGADAGVIVYQVAIEDDNASDLTQPVIFLRTPTGLDAGQQFQSGEALKLTVGADFYGGVSIEVVTPPGPPWQCGEWGRQLVQLETLLNRALDADNPDTAAVRSLQARIAQLEARMAAAGCR